MRLSATSVFIVLAVYVGAGCAPMPSPVNPISVSGKLAREDLYQVKKGMTEDRVLAICKEPLARRAPSRAETHEMWPGSEWDSAWIYSGETIPGQYAAGSVLIFFSQGKAQSWSFPFITKGQYLDIVKRVNTRTVKTATGLESIWGWPAEITRLPGGVMSTSYHLVQPDGTVYQSAIVVLYAAGGNIYSVSLENLQH